MVKEKNLDALTPAYVLLNVIYEKCSYRGFLNQGAVLVVLFSAIGITT